MPKNENVTSFGGRGRGWLNLNKNTSSSNNLKTMKTCEIPKSSPIPSDEPEFSDASEYSDLLSRVKDFNLEDDGIKLNQKIKRLLDTWKEACHNSVDVENSFDIVYEECTKDMNLASKLVIMISTRSFANQEVNDQNIRLLFLKKLQRGVEDSVALQKRDPKAFRNTILMLGEFYNKAKMINGLRYTFMIEPLLSCLELLLQSGQTSDLEQFTWQIYLNGAEMNTESSGKVSKMFFTIRNMLCAEKNISKTERLWLMLALEIANNNFASLPADVLTFYQQEIDGTLINQIQGASSMLIVQTPEENTTLDSSHSNMHVLQLSKKSESSAVADKQTSDNSNKIDHNSSSSTTSGHSNETSNSINSIPQNSGKYGRPILGAGARLNKNKLTDTTTSNSNNWRDRDNTNAEPPRWNKTNTWKEHDKNSKGKNKGWEHDDRFENDYS